MRLKKYIKRTDEQKLAIIAEYETGVPVKQLFTKHNISTSLLYTWLRKFSEDKETNNEV